jgi:hypothetical protein
MSGPFIGKGLKGAVLGSRTAVRASAPSIIALSRSVIVGYRRVSRLTPA